MKTPPNESNVDPVLPLHLTNRILRLIISSTGVFKSWNLFSESPPKNLQSSNGFEQSSIKLEELLHQQKAHILVATVGHSARIAGLRNCWLIKRAVGRATFQWGSDRIVRRKSKFDYVMGRASFQWGSDRIVRCESKFIGSSQCPVDALDPAS